MARVFSVPTASIRPMQTTILLACHAVAPATAAMAQVVTALRVQPIPISIIRLVFPVQEIR